MTVYLVISLLKIAYMHRIYMVLANPTHLDSQDKDKVTGKDQSHKSADTFLWSADKCRQDKSADKTRQDKSADTPVVCRHACGLQTRLSSADECRQVQTRQMQTRQDKTSMQTCLWSADKCRQEKTSLQACL